MSEGTWHYTPRPGCNHCNGELVGKSDPDKEAMCDPDAYEHITLMCLDCGRLWESGLPKKDSWRGDVH